MRVGAFEEVGEGGRDVVRGEGREGLPLTVHEGLVSSFPAGKGREDALQPDNFDPGCPLFFAVLRGCFGVRCG